MYNDKMRSKCTNMQNANTVWQLLMNNYWMRVFLLYGIIKIEVSITSRSRSVWLISLIISDITKTESNNCFIMHWMKKKWIHVFASSLTASNTKRANLTWLPLEIMYRGHAWHDYPWPWLSLTWLLYNLQLWRHERWFRKFSVRFWPIRKELESSMYKIQ